MRINQTGLPPGVESQARRDGLANGATVTLISTDPNAAFALLYVPSADATAVESLVAVQPGTWTFNPTVGVTGPYRIRESRSSGEVEIRIFGIADGTGNVSPAPGERADPTATVLNATDADVIARCERNWPTTRFPAGNPFGWFESIGGSGGPVLRMEVDWCLTTLPPHETDGNHLSGNSESGALVVDFPIYGKATTEGRFIPDQLVIVPFDGGGESAIYRVVQDSDDGWELERQDPVIPAGVELEIRVRYGASWGGCVFLTNAAELSWGPPLRIRPAATAVYPILSEVLNCSDAIAGGYPYGYRNNELLINRMNMLDASSYSGELVYLISPSNSDAVLSCRFGIHVISGGENPLLIAPGSSQTIEGPGTDDANTVSLPALKGLTAEWMMCAGGVWRMVSYWPGIS